MHACQKITVKIRALYKITDFTINWELGLAVNFLQSGGKPRQQIKKLPCCCCRLPPFFLSGCAVQMERPAAHAIGRPAAGGAFLLAATT